MYDGGENVDFIETIAASCSLVHTRAGDEQFWSKVLRDSGDAQLKCNEME